MSDNFTGCVKLYHPRGPQVTLSIPADPAEAFAHIGRCLDVGWLVIAPGLEEGEMIEHVGYFVRGCHENTPFLLLYSTNDGQNSFSFLKVYLNDDDQIAAFEAASKIKLESIPEYLGADKPERGKSAKLDAFIVRAKRPFNVVMKKNPKFDEAQRVACAAKNEIYKVPARLFVRWADQAAGPEVPKTDQHGEIEKPANAPATQPPTESPIEIDLQKCLTTFETLKTLEKLDQWCDWAAKKPLTQAQMDRLDDGYAKAKARIEGKQPPSGRKPAMAAPPGQGEGIPF